MDSRKSASSKRVATGQEVTYATHKDFAAGYAMNYGFLNGCNLYCGRDSILWRVFMVSLGEVATSQEPLSDEEVVARVLAGETAMFEIVMRRHNQRLYRVARAI